jgi:hypothetical protein
MNRCEAVRIVSDPTWPETDISSIYLPWDMLPRLPYFRAREARLAGLIGSTAARPASRAMGWFLAGFLCYGASFVLVWRFFPNGTVSFAILVFGLVGIGTVASVRFTVLRIRSAQLA